MNMEQIYESKQRIFGLLFTFYLLISDFILILVIYFLQISFMGSTDVILCHT